VADQLHQIANAIVIVIIIMVIISCSGDFHNGHSSCSGISTIPPYCTSIISAGISRLHVQEYLTKESLKQLHLYSLCIPLMLVISVLLTVFS
jgi:hypothetical protein